MDTPSEAEQPAQVGNPNELTVIVLSPDAILFDGTATHILAPSHDLTLGILAGHTPMYAEIIAGDIHIEGPTPTTLSVTGGMLKVINNEVTILIIPVTVEEKSKE